MSADEGVTKFEIVHETDLHLTRRYEAQIRELSGWRRIMRETKMLGCDPARYGGVGFGNVSARVEAPSSAPGARAFVITGTQTAHRPVLGLEDWCVVRTYDLERNRVHSVGAVQPSSESMTHGAIYDLDAEVRVILHGHSPAIWHAAAALDLPISAPQVAYGTPEMAEEIARLYRESSLPEVRALAMGGHEDGVIAFGATAAEAGANLMRCLAEAYALPSTCGA